MNDTPYFVMESSNNLEIKGSLQTNPFAELVREIKQERFSGALRLAHEARKTVVYFDDGAIIFAVSNQRPHRLFEILLGAKDLTQNDLLTVPNFADDAVLKKHLAAHNLLNESQIAAAFERQIAVVLQAAVQMSGGEWIFSPLVRLKSDLRCLADVDAAGLEYARTLSVAEAQQKFKNHAEILTAIAALPADINLSPSEWFVYSRFENAALTRAEIQNLSGLPEAETGAILYALWLGGLLERAEFHHAFSERYIASVASARLTAKKDDAPESAAAVIAAPSAASPSEDSPSAPPVETTPPDQPAGQISLENYLLQIDEAENFYEIFAVAPDEKTAEIKKIYFGLAKKFHPDLFRKEPDQAVQRRIQHAFTELAHAYDTLKNEKTREVYDFKMRREIAEMVERQESGMTEEEADSRKQNDQAAENFDQGFDHLMEDDYEAALPFLARAAFFAKDNARYRAYHGKVLAADERQSHRAEAEFQAAIKLDSQNPDYRIMLAEFFINIGLLKRAEGELNRLLAVVPNHREAQKLLDDLKAK